MGKFKSIALSMIPFQVLIIIINAIDTMGAYRTSIGVKTGEAKMA